MATLLTGFGSPVYYAAFVTAGALAIISVFKSGDRSSIWAIATIFVFSAHAVITAFSASSYGDLVRLVPITTVILLGDCARRQRTEQFEKVMILTALVHIPILFSTYWGARSEIQNGARLAGDNVAVAALAEIAIGTAWAGILSNRKSVAIFSLSAAFLVIIMTQMRTAGLAVFITLTFYVIAKVVTSRKTKARYAVILSLVGASIFYISTQLASIQSAINLALLLDDPHRGLSSGFSGRFSNFYDGWAAFLANPVLGSGSTDLVVNFTHNGYILTLAQFGLPIALLCFAFLTSALIKSYRYRNIAIFSVIMGLLFFYIGQPRNINTQLCPLIGILVAFRSQKTVL